MFLITVSLSAGFICLYIYTHILHTHIYCNIHTCINICACVWSRFSHIQIFATPWTVAHRASLSMGFSQQEYWSGLPFPPPGGLPNPGIEPTSPSPELLKDSLLLSYRESQNGTSHLLNKRKGCYHCRMPFCTQETALSQPRPDCW